MNKQRQHINLSRIMAFVLSVAMLAGFCPPGVSLADIPVTLPKVKAADSISNSRIVKDSSMDAGQKVTWDCVYFGSYPQSEVTSKDGSIYNALKNATGWDSNNDITIGGMKYRRLKGEDATYADSDESGQYNWNDNYKNYHYFKYEPIKWRVLNRKSRAAARSGISTQSAPGTVQTLQKNVYASAKPQLLHIYNEQSKTWSTPAVIEEDGTADFDAVAAVDGENVYVAWVNAKRTFTQAEAKADDFMTKLAVSTEIHAAN